MNFKDLIKKQSWQEQQLFTLSFKNLSFSQVQQRLNSFQINCSTAFLSSTTSHRVILTVVFIVDTESSKSDPAIIEQALHMLFPEAGKRENPDEIPITNILFENYEYIVNPLNILVASELYFISNVSKNTRTKRFEELGKKENSINILIGDTKIPNIIEINDYDSALRNAASGIRILHDFINGKHVELISLIGIASSLSYIKGGLKWFKDVMEDHGIYNENELFVNSYIRNRDFLPLPFKYFSPYLEDHVQGSLLMYLHLPHGMVMRTTPYEYKTLSIAEKEVKEIMQGIKLSNDNNIHVVNAATGVGKTELILDWNNVAIAFPDHALKNEVASRMKIPYVSTPNILEFIDPSDKAIIEHSYKVGADRFVQKFLRGRKEAPEKYFIGKKISKYASYYEEINKCRTANKTLLTTHAWLQNTNVKQDTIIYDEDALTTSFVETRYTSISDIRTLYLEIMDIDDRNILMHIMDLCIKAPKNVALELPEFIFNDYSTIVQAAIRNRKIKGAILDFLNSRHFVMAHDTDYILFLKITEPPANKKIVILSATANEWIYKRLFGERLKFYDVGSVELKGTLVQDTTYTFSRQNLSNPAVLKYALEKAADRMVITFRSLTPEFENAFKDIYFGNCMGKDGYQGNALAVIGTFNINPAAYILYAKALKLQVKLEDFTMEKTTVQRNGIRFNFFTFENEDLQNLHFYFVERELRQSIGRARLSRNEHADVLLFSGYALPEARQLNEIKTM